ncbi:MAG: ROK family protein, partial [Ktedonobacteraceae bacterium]|nr:ROK family protein [Ktedonobacteraceae bacterium]
MIKKNLWGLHFPMNAHTAFEHPSNILPLVVGIDLGGTQIRVAVLQGSNVRARVSTLTGEDSAPERVLPRMFQTVEQALHEAGVS